MRHLPYTLGIETLLQKKEVKSWGRCLLLANQASVIPPYTSSILALQDYLGPQLQALLSPQHGIHGVTQDNMIESAHGQDPISGLPVYSLYSKIRSPQESFLKNFDTLIIDLQLSGCRVYTFKATIKACLQAAKATKTQVVICDRPNPLGGVVIEGRTLDNDCHSFVGPDSLPMRHGLSSAEAAKFFNRTIGAELTCIPLNNWNPSSLTQDWIPTSPNLAHRDALFLYPGMVIFEACNLSEGRGTALPFQIIGSPYCQDIRPLIKGSHPGVTLRPCFFEPTYGKGRGKICAGVQIHIDDPQQVRSYTLAIKLLQAFMSTSGFAFKEPPYEYEYTTPPIDLVLGTRNAAQKLKTYSAENSFWREGINDYCQQVADYLLYPRTMQT